MFRFLLSAASVFVLISGMILPDAIAASRCGERMPVTLLALYRDSESIYVGRYEKTEDGEPTEDTADYTVVPITKHFTISSALKGEPRKLLTLEDSEYRYKNQEVSEEGSEHDEGEGDESVDLKGGDSVLLFLKKNADTELLEPTDFVDGIKKMTPDKLSAYEARIRELRGILAAEKPKYSQLLEWLVRCAEDPHTRWEGTFELLQSFQNMDWQAERAKQVKEKPAEGESAESGEYEAEDPKEFETGDPNFARNLTEAQKGILTNVLLKSERPKRSENSEAQASVTVGDRELIELVKRWGDPRVAAHLLEQLRQDTSDTNLNSELMASIASMLHDVELTRVADDYSNIQWESDDAEVVTEAQPEPAKPAEATEPAPEPDPPAEPATTTSEGEADPESTEKPVKKTTYAELKADLLGKFLSRADKVIEKEQNNAGARAVK